MKKKCVKKTLLIRTSDLLPLAYYLTKRPQKPTYCLSMNDVCTSWCLVSALTKCGVSYIWSSSEYEWCIYSETYTLTTTMEMLKLIVWFHVSCYWVLKMKLTEKLTPKCILCNHLIWPHITHNCTCFDFRPNYYNAKSKE